MSGENYRCPICNGGPNRYLECEYPGCPDGRDQSRLRSWFPEEKIVPKKRSDYEFMLSIVLFAVALAWLFLTPAYGMNHGFDPDAPTTKWFELLQRPDSEPNSCCGKGDAYPVDRYEKINERGDYRVWLSDGDAIVYPDGTQRDYFDKEVPIEVPFNKVNKEIDDIDNPTEHSWLFMRVSTPRDPGTIYCFVRHPNGS
jgi:hypothetical protein